MSCPSISRREFLRLLALAGSGLFVSCNQQSVPTQTNLPHTPGPIPPTHPSAVPTGTQAISTPIQAPPVNLREKINTVVILLEENHSFDSLFAGYPGVNGKAAPNKCPDAIQHFIREGGTSIEYYCSYTEQQVPNYWKLARSFTLCDNYYSEVRGPSFPNYMMLTSAQTTQLKNPAPPFECPNYCSDVISIANRLDDKGLTWHDYGGLFANIKSLQGRSEISYKNLDGFFQDAAGGRLTNVSWIGTFLVGGTRASGHPPGNICDAENYAVQITNAVMAGSQWPTTLMFIIWDEWGAFYEHTVPPVVERLSNGTPLRYGFRVPCLVISPYAKAGAVVHTEFSHVSTLRSLESIFEITALNDRDATANDLLECLDFTQAPIAPFTLSERRCST